MTEDYYALPSLDHVHHLSNFPPPWVSDLLFKADCDAPRSIDEVDAMPLEKISLGMTRRYRNTFDTISFTDSLVADGVEGVASLHISSAPSSPPPSPIELEDRKGPRAPLHRVSLQPQVEQHRSRQPLSSSVPLPPLSPRIRGWRSPHGSPKMSIRVL